MPSVLKTFAVLAAVFAICAQNASAALPYWWWTPTKANRAVVSKNPQLWQNSSDPPVPTQITRAACRGYGLAKKQRGMRYYRHFLCKVSWSFQRPENPGPFTSPLLCDTTRLRQPLALGIRCRLS